jgi:hypothetical protein
MSLLDQINAKSDPADREPLLNVAAERATHLAACRICGEGNTAACAPGRALAHAVASASAEASRTVGAEHLLDHGSDAKPPLEKRP